jgi:hypothetical protein
LKGKLNYRLKKHSKLVKLKTVKAHIKRTNLDKMVAYFQTEGNTGNHYKNADLSEYLASNRASDSELPRKE